MYFVCDVRPLFKPTRLQRYEKYFSRQKNLDLNHDNRPKTYFCRSPRLLAMAVTAQRIALFESRI